MDCFHLWVKNTARGICSAWGNLVHFFSTFRLKTDKTSLFECFLTMSLKYLVWSHFCNALKSTSHFPYPNMLWEGKSLIRAAWWNQFNFFSSFPLKANNTSLFEWMLTMSLKYLVWSHFCNALKNTSHFPYRNMLWEGKKLGRAVWWNQVNFLSLFCLEPHKT